jgi:hypothetical protein
MDQLAIYNMAISLVGGRKLLSTISDVLPETEQCNLWYAASRDYAFRMAYWPELRATATLSLVSQNDFADAWTSADPPLPWRFAYTRPANMFAMRYVLEAAAMNSQPNPKRWDFAQHDTLILTNAEAAVGVYTVLRTDPAAWGPHLAQTVANVLASNIATALSGKLEIGNALLQRAQLIANTAMGVQANTDQQTLLDPESEILQARSGFSPPYGGTR